MARRQPWSIAVQPLLHAGEGRVRQGRDPPRVRRLRQKDKPLAAAVVSVTKDKPLAAAVVGVTKDKPLAAAVTSANLDKALGVVASANLDKALGALGDRAEERPGSFAADEDSRLQHGPRLAT